MLASRVLFFFFFFLMIRRPPRSTPFPTRRSSDLIPEPDLRGTLPPPPCHRAGSGFSARFLPAIYSSPPVQTGSSISLNCPQVPYQTRRFSARLPLRPTDGIPARQAKKLLFFPAPRRLIPAPVVKNPAPRRARPARALPRCPRK